MNRASWLNALLAVAVAALGAWVYFKPAKETVVDYPLSALKPAEVTSVHIERPDMRPCLSRKKAAPGA